MECQDWKSVVDAVNEPAVQRICEEVERLREENEALKKALEVFNAPFDWLDTAYQEAGRFRLVANDGVIGGRDDSLHDVYEMLAELSGIVVSSFEESGVYAPVEKK